MYKYLIIGVFISLIPVTLYSQAWKKAPEWVTKSPADQRFYYGIGFSPIDEKGEYRKVARENAVREIAEKIMVQINSTSSLKTNVTTDSYTYLLNSDIQTNTINFFEDLRLEADWTDFSNGDYYALYKLDIDHYRANREQYTDLVITTAAGYIEKSRLEFASGNYDHSMRLLGEAMRTILPDMNRLVELDYHSKLKSVQFEVENTLRDQLNALKLIVDQKEYVFDPTSETPTRILINVRNSANQLQYKKLPMYLRSLKGDVFSHKFLPASEGMALDLYGILPDAAIAKIQLYPDLPSPLKDLYREDHPLLEAPLEIKFEPVPIKFIVRENILGKKTNSGYAESFFSSFLSHCSVIESPKEATPSYNLIIHTTIDPVSPYKKTKGVSMKMDIKIIDNSNHQVVFSEKTENKRGFGKTYSGAVKSAYDHFIESSDPLLGQIVEVLCSVKSTLYFR